MPKYVLQYLSPAFRIAVLVGLWVHFDTESISPLKEEIKKNQQIMAI